MHIPLSAGGNTTAMKAREGEYNFASGVIKKIWTGHLYLT